MSGAENTAGSTPPLLPIIGDITPIVELTIKTTKRVMPTATAISIEPR